MIRTHSHFVAPMYFGVLALGRAAAILFSLTQSAKRNGIDPEAFLADLLRRIPTHPQKRINELLPDQWKDARPTGRDAAGESSAPVKAVANLDALSQIPPAPVESTGDE